MEAVGPPTCQLNEASKVKCQTINNTDCLKALCEPKTGKCALKPVANGTLCDNGQKCTENDVCVFGQCQAGNKSCECVTNPDCLFKDDGDLCNGTLYCATATGKCLLDSATVVTCQTGNNSTCKANICSPATGKCAVKPQGEGQVCDDGNPCSKSTLCKAGVCEGEHLPVREGRRLRQDG